MFTIVISVIPFLQIINFVGNIFFFATVFFTSIYDFLPFCLVGCLLGWRWGAVPLLQSLCVVLFVSLFASLLLLLLLFYVVVVCFLCVFFVPPR